MKLLITTLLMSLILTSCNDNRGKKETLHEMQESSTGEWKPVALHFGNSREESNFSYCEEYLNLLKGRTSYKHRCVLIK